MKLNVACAEDVREGYINIDLNPPEGYEGIQQADALDLPFDDDTFEEILVSHFLEHLKYREITKGLLEWKRVLHPEGKLVICVPDFSVIASKWASADLQTKLGWWTPAAFGSQRGLGQEHHAAWDEDVFNYYLKQANFFDWKFYKDEKWDFWLWVDVWK